jgi:EAL domain-containing protein (putative c-di-GMP-specific phosphodiesterase class I)
MYLERFFADDASAVGCIRCRDAEPFEVDLKMAFQPIIDLEARRVYAYEALVRGADGQSAGWVLEQVMPQQLYTFDQTCRVLAIETAARLGLQQRLSINFIPNAVYQPAACIRLTLAAAAKVGFPTERLTFELTESERIDDPAHALGIFAEYRKRGFRTAIDDFGAGYSGLSLLAEFQPDVVKLDMALVRDIDSRPAKRAIIVGIVGMCRELGCQVVAEGVETLAELQALRALDVRMFQGYLIARPGLEQLPEPDWQALGQAWDEGAGDSASSQGGQDWKNGVRDNF